MAKIIGNTTATTTPRSDWNQTDETKADYIKNKPTILTEEDVVEIVESGSNGSGHTHNNKDILDKLSNGWVDIDSSAVETVKYNGKALRLVDEGYVIQNYTITDENIILSLGDVTLENGVTIPQIINIPINNKTEGDIPAVHTLPTEATDGDMCLYSPANIIESGKRIYFDWEEFRKPVDDSYEMSGVAQFLDESSYEANNGNPPFEFAINKYDSYCFFTMTTYTPDYNTSYFIEFDDTGNLVDGGAGCNKHCYSDDTYEEIYYTSIDELPKYIDVPMYDYFMEGSILESSVPFFYAPYRLMVYRAGEWQSLINVGGLTDEQLAVIKANVTARHEHSNKDVLDNITPDMFEGRVPVVYELPKDANDGDLCLYTQANTITLDDSGKRIYFDWKNIKHYSKNDDLILYEFYDNNSTRIGYIKIDGEYREYSFHHSIEDPISDEQYFVVGFDSYGKFNGGGIYKKSLNGDIARIASFPSIEYVPTYWDLPEFDKIISFPASTTEASLFHVAYKFMICQGGEWQNIESLLDIGSDNSVDLADYYTKQEIDDKNFVTEEDLPDGVYVGSGEMPDNCNVQIDPEGTVLTIPTKTSELVNDSGFITLDDLPENDSIPVIPNTGVTSIITDPTLTIEGGVADAKATGDRLTDIEYQTVTTDLAFEHKGLPIGEKTVTVSGDGTFGNNAYVVCGEDIIPRKTFNKTFPYNSITITKNDKTYHIEGTATADGYVCLTDSLDGSMFEINEDISGKAFKLLSFSNQYLNQWSFVVRFYDADKKSVQVLKSNGSLSASISTYVGSDNGYRETNFSIPENVEIKYAQATINFKSGNTYNHDFQIYMVEADDIQAVTIENPTVEINNENVTSIFSAPYQNTTETKAPIVDYIGYMANNAKGDTATYLTPEAFGAVGDGYADDTEAVKACIAKAEETTQTVFMAKKYLITTPIEIYQSGLDLIANDIVYSGNDAAIKIQGNNNTLKLHNLTSNGIGIVFTGGGEKHMLYNTIDVNEIKSTSHGIVFYFNQKGIMQNTIRFNHIRCNGSGCYGIAYLDHENKLDTAFIGENNFYGGHISHCEWACYRVGGNAKFYGVHIETDVEGGFYIKDGVRIIQPRFAESARDGSYPFFKILNARGVKIDSSSLCAISEIDISENQDYYENASGVQYPAHEGNFGIIEIPLIMPRQATGEDMPTGNVYTNKAYIWGKHLIMTPYMAYRKAVTTETLDTRLIAEVKDTINETLESVFALSQLPTKFVVDTVNTNIYLHSSYCAFGFNEFEVEQANGFTCKIYDCLENLIFDGTDKGNGLYKLNVYKDADICKNRAGTKGMLSVDFMGHYWQVTKATTVDDVLAALPTWSGGAY